MDIIADGYDEDDEEMFTISLSTPNQATLRAGSTSTTISIMDNDDPPLVSIAEMSNVTETDAEIDTTIAVTLDSASGKTVTVPYTVMTGTATSADFTLDAGEVVFEPNTTTTITALSMNIPFKITGDTLDENEEQFTITLGGSTLANATINDSAKLGTVKITDNDPEPALTIDNEAVAEGTAIVFTPTLSTESGRDVVITYFTEASGSFPAGVDDYSVVAEADLANSVPATTITIPAGQTTPTETLRITTRMDEAPEPDETFTLSYTATNVSTETATGTATGTIENNDPRTIAITSITVDEGDGSAELDVTMSPAPDADSGPIEVIYTLSTDSANTDDYTHTIEPLTFAVGENKKIISITIKDDDLSEETETITVQLNHAGINLYQGGIGTITIEDNDTTLPTISLAMEMQEVEEGTGTNVDPEIVVKLTDGSGNDIIAGRTITVDFALTEDTAMSPEDYAIAADATSTLTFSPGESSKAIPIEIKPDNYDEENEKFTVTLTDPSQAILGIASSTITINDNDLPPKVSIVEFVTENETDSDRPSSVTVTLKPASGKTVTVPYFVTSDTADENDYSVATVANRLLMFTPDANSTITASSMEIPYTILGDDIGEKPEEFTIALGATTNGDITGEDTQATIKIIDDEAPVLSIGNGDAVTESDQTLAMFPINASFNANEITVYFTPDVASRDFLASHLTENEMISATLDFEGGTNAILSVPIANDTVKEDDGFITVTLVEDQYMENNQPVITYSVATSPEDSGTAVVIDDDSLPVVSIIPDSGEVAENAGPAKFMLAATGLTATTTLMINATPAEDGGDFLTDSIAETAEDFSVEFSDIDDDNIYTR